jgi:hypothetical protein
VGLHAYVVIHNLLKLRDELDRRSPTATRRRLYRVLAYVAGAVIFLPFLAGALQVVGIRGDVVKVLSGLTFLGSCLAIPIIGGRLGKWWITLVGVPSAFLISIAQHMLFSSILGYPLSVERAFRILVYVFSLGGIPMVMLALAIHGLTAHALRVRRKGSLEHHWCRRCDYDLTGNVSGVCPECGTPVPGTPKGDGGSSGAAG